MSDLATKRVWAMTWHNLRKTKTGQFKLDFAGHCKGSFLAQMTRNHQKYFQWKQKKALLIKMLTFSQFSSWDLEVWHRRSRRRKRRMIFSIGLSLSTLLNCDSITYKWVVWLDLLPLLNIQCILWHSFENFNLTNFKPCCPKSQFPKQ